MQWLRWGLDALIVALLLIVGACGAVYYYAAMRAPGLDGQLELPGLRAPAEVIRDQRGIPHIAAGNAHDLYLAQGYAMAQDRMWQMDLMRRAGEGRLSEVLGPATLELDRKSRQLGLGRAAAAEAARLPPREAELLDAFSTGVNLYITRRAGRMPIEFWLLRYRPELWRNQDTLALAAYLYQVLGSNYEDKLERETFAAALGAGPAGELFPDHSPWDIVPGEAGGAAPAPLPRAVAAAAPPVFPAAFSWGSSDSDRAGGSNDWVLAGSRSLSGKPILANDPHLRYQVPGLWWAAELTAPGIHVAGVAITGVPGIIIGHNDRIAWGVTNVRADVQDLYRETLDDRGNVRTAQGWTPLQHWREVIRVKGAADVRMDIPVTPHGPIIARDAGGPLALGWSLYAPGALQDSAALYAVDQAANWAQFEAALAQFAGPAQNFVYADIDGHIGYQCAGWIPIRKLGDGTVPVPGDDPRYDWRGWIPFAQLPRVVDPANGVVATANGRITPDGYPYVISKDWDAPNRTRRIYGMLNGLARWNASAMPRLQEDVMSEQDRDFAAALVVAGRAAAAAGETLPAATQQALGLLRGFRGAMGRASLAPTLAVETRDEFLRRVIAARAGAPLALAYRWDEAPVFAQALLAAPSSGSLEAWLPPAYRDWNRLLLDCLGSVALRFGLDAKDAHWGKFETLEADHPVYSHIPLIRDYADLGPVEINGSPLTVKQARNTALGDRTDLGPSMRMVADVGNWDHSTLTLFAGESGQIFSPYYRDEFQAYLRGVALPLWFTPQAVRAHAVHWLELRP